MHTCIQGWTSLHMAATGNKLDTVKALLEIVDDIQLDAQNNEARAKSV